MSNDDDFAAQLAELNAAFAAGLPKRLDDIEAAMQAFIRAPHDRNALMQMHKLLHSLAGSAGIFGFDRLGQCARRVEHHCDSWLEGAAIDQQALESLPAMVEQLRLLAK